MNLNGVLIGTDDPERLVAFYTKVLGEPAGSDGGYTWWQIGTGGLALGAHSEVKGKSVHPGRVIWGIESDDVRGDFERFKAAGATVIREPYDPAAGTGSEQEDMGLIATFADPDDNYFQLVSPMP